MPQTIYVLEGFSDQAIDQVANRLSCLGHVVLFEVWVEVNESNLSLIPDSMAERLLQWSRAWANRLESTLKNHPGKDIFIARGPLSSVAFAPPGCKDKMMAEYWHIRKRFVEHTWRNVHVFDQKCTVQSQMEGSHYSLSEMERAREWFSNYRGYYISVSPGLNAPEAILASKTPKTYYKTISPSVTRPSKAILV